MNPAVVGWSFAPRMLAMRPSSTATSSTQVSGQSIGQVVLSVVMENSRIYSPLLTGGTPEPICLMAILAEETLMNCGKCLSLTTEGWEGVPQEHHETDKQYKMPYACESKKRTLHKALGLVRRRLQCQSAPEVCTLDFHLLCGTCAAWFPLRRLR